MLYNWFQNIEFAYPWVLPFLGMVPLIAWLRSRTQKGKRSVFTVSTAEAFRVRTFRSRLVHLPLWLRLLALTCLIIALARPRTAHVLNKNRGEGIDIVLCMDVSGSMLSPDFYPNRLEVSKEMAISFVQDRPVDAIGLVIFSGESYTQYPLSADHEGLIQQIRSLKSGMLEDGTLIGEGLATAVDRLTNSKSKSKVIILLTDGKEEAPDTRLIDPATALEIAKARRVKVYTIGMGTDQQMPVSERGATRPGSYFLDEALMRRIALQTGGEYFRATDKEGLEQVYRQIDRLEKSEIEVISRTRYAEQAVYFILAALFLLFLELLLKYTLLRTFP